VIDRSPRSREHPKVALVTLGCARNDVDSEELAGRLAAEGWDVAASADGVDGDADVVVVNTCTFVEQAKKDSVDAVLAAGGGDAKVVAVGCMAERYGAELAEALPEAAAVLGFDHYGDLPSRLDDVLAGRPLASHTPTDRRTLLPISPVKRPEAVERGSIPGHEWLPEVSRRRLDDAPVAPLKLASGCDRRCSFCAIPSFRGAFVSRDPRDVIAEAAWLADHGVAEVLLVSENSTSYGKDIDARGAAGGALERLLGELAAVPGMRRVRVSYLQPAEVRPPLLRAIAATPRVASYFDLSFQHASAPVLRRMRRFGSRETFLALCREIRALDPEAGIRSNVIVGFPGETEDDLAELEAFLAEAELDAVGVFGYSDEDGTEALDLPDKVDAGEIAVRVERITRLAEHVAEDRAARRVGTTVEVLVERREADDDTDEGAECWVGRAAHQGPEVDGECRLVGAADLLDGLAPGVLVSGRVVDAEGIDLVVEALAVAHDTGADADDAQHVGATPVGAGAW
jgi:ribosomal protein S12 methylthiotransferase RimO